MAQIGSGLSFPEKMEKMINSLTTKHAPNFRQILPATHHRNTILGRQSPVLTAAKKFSAVKIKAMRAVVQRVASASVEVSNINWIRKYLPTPLCLLGLSWAGTSNGLQVEGRVVSSIGPGLMVLVGLHESDVDSDADYLYA